MMTKLTIELPEGFEEPFALVVLHKGDGENDSYGLLYNLEDETTEETGSGTVRQVMEAARYMIQDSRLQRALKARGW